MSNGTGAAEVKRGRGRPRLGADKRSVTGKWHLTPEEAALVDKHRGRITRGEFISRAAVLFLKTVLARKQDPLK